MAVAFNAENPAPTTQPDRSESGSNRTRPKTASTGDLSSLAAVAFSGSAADLAGLGSAATTDAGDYDPAGTASDLVAAHEASAHAALMKSDGSTPFSAAVVGVDPSSDDELATRGSVAAQIVAALAGIGASSWTTTKKIADETRVSTTALVNDAALTSVLLANSSYVIRGEVFYDCNATPDFKYGLAFTVAPTRIRASRSQVIAGATAFSGIAVDATVPTNVPLAGTGTSGWVQFSCVVSIGALPSTVSFQWAQNTSSALATTVLAGSYLEVCKL